MIITLDKAPKNILQGATDEVDNRRGGGMETWPLSVISLYHSLKHLM